MTRWFVLVVATAGAIAGCDFTSGLAKCFNDGRCGSDGAVSDDDGADAGMSCETDGGTLWLGPLPYLSFADSPFPCRGHSEFFFSDFEDPRVMLPGLTHNATRRDTSAADSVDFDDGRIDGTCRKQDGGYCGALYVSSGEAGITLEFDAGALPTFVGLVWTDGRKFIRVEAFGPDHQSLGVVGPESEAGSPDSQQGGQTAEDRFFGVVSPRGISSVKINTGDAGGMEIDHVHYGG